MAERDEVRNEAGMLFRSSSFAKLEALAGTYRDQSLRTSSGAWKLLLFYEGVANVGLNFSKDEQEQWRESLGRFDNWIDKYPESATPHIAKAAALMERGWAMRGRGYVRGVSEAHLRTFQALAVETGKYLLEHEALKLKDPHWYLLMTTVYQALGVNKEAFWELYTEGLELYPDYDPTIFIAANYYAPRWYGSYEEVEKLARYTSEATEDARDFAPYARIYWVAGFNRDGSQYLFQLPSANWSDMVRGMDAVLARYPGQWNINKFAYYACFARDREVAARYIELLNEPINKSIWFDDLNYHSCRKYIGLPPSPNPPTSQ